MMQIDTSTSPADPREIAAALELPLVESLAGASFSADFTARIPIAFARRYRLIGLVGADDGTLRVALADRAGFERLDTLWRYLRREIEPVVAQAPAINAAINQAYEGRDSQTQSVIGQFDAEAILDELDESSAHEDLLDVSAKAPVIKLVDMILFDAVRAAASDVHLQPYEDRLVVRMRVDGVLYDSFSIPKSVQEEVLGRVKVMGRMNIAEKRLAQDGRATVQAGDRLVDLRIASLPTSCGERIVVRLLDKGARLYRLAELGMPPETLHRFRRFLECEHGLLLVTGPTGSGKSTTLYAALKELDCAEHNILTLEDPIEYQLDGISQTQVSDRKGMTFAGGLRHVLRQDPDVIMVGEIRDRETAAMAIQSALTGHLVFSTLHTNDAASAVARLLDLGVEPYLVASSLLGVLAQRLVRRVCTACHESLSTPAPDGVSPPRRRGCDNCRGTGFRGRIGIFELLEVTDVIRQHIQSRSAAAAIKSAAEAAGMRTLREGGMEKVRGGLTTAAEVQRVTMRDLESAESVEADAEAAPT